MEQIGSIHSLCPECLAKIEGIKYVEDGKVYIMKDCPDHGEFVTLVSEDVDHYLQMEECFDVDRAKPRTSLTDVERGCPFDCGLCPSHKQDTCLAIVEVTDRCNMSCTYCFANSSMDASLDPDMETIRKMFETVKKCQNDPTCIQISGGEPTLRDDLPEIIRMGKEIGISHIELNTNGVRISKDQEYFDRIAAAGVDAIYLGFDGVSDDVYMQRTGRKMLEVKTEVINRCEKAGIGVVLVPLVAKGYNLHEVGKIIKFAASNVPAVRGVHFQPVFHSGRSPSDMADKVTILNLLQEIEKQTDGQLNINNFTPSLMPNAHCGATCLTLVDGDEFLPLTNVSLGAAESAFDVANKTKKSIMGRWKGLEKDEKSTSSCGDLLIKSSCCETSLSDITVKGSCCEKSLGDITVKGSCCEQSLSDILPKNSSSKLDNGWADFIERSKDNYLTISTMAFQDAWSYEQNRVENCCIHVVTQDGRFIPFCNYNMTDCNGKFLYRNAA